MKAIKIAEEDTAKDEKTDKAGGDMYKDLNEIFKDDIQIASTANVEKNNS